MIARIAIVGALAALLLLAWWFFRVGSALGHEQGAGAFINRKLLSDPSGRGRCCNHQDCQPIPRGGLEERGNGFFVVETGEQIPYSRVLWESEDGRWWRCRFLQDVSEGGVMGWHPPGSKVKYRKGDTRCLIGPPMGM